VAEELRWRATAIDRYLKLRLRGSQLNFIDAFAAFQEKAKLRATAGRLWVASDFGAGATCYSGISASTSLARRLSDSCQPR
jgi:hypothetical protein